MTIGTATIDGTAHPITIEPDAGRFELRIGDAAAIVTFGLKGSGLALTHTEVPPVFRGKGVGDAIVRAVLDYARAQGMTVKPYCPFVGRFIDKHQEYASLVDPAFPKSTH